MARGKRKNESDAGPEWKIETLYTGADPDDWDFYPQRDIPQDQQHGRSTEQAADAWFTQPRRRG